MVAFFGTMVQAVVVWHYYEGLFSPRTRWSLGACILGYGGIFALAQGENSLLTCAAFWAVNGLILWQCYDCKGILAHSGILTAIFSVTAIAEGWFLGIMPEAGLLAAVMTRLLYALVVLAVLQFLLDERERSKDAWGFSLVAVLPILSAEVILVLLFVQSFSEMSETVRLLIVSVVGILLCANIVIGAMYLHLKKLHEERLAMELSLLREQADSRYYAALREQDEQQRILIHDIRSHLNTISALARTENAGAVSDYLQKLDLPAPAAKLCPEPTLNLILERYQGICREKDIDFHVDVRRGCQGVLDGPSTTTLYGNLLSNAVEAAEHSRERTIELSVTSREEQGAILVTVVNSCDQQPTRDRSGNFRTRKRNGTLHGVGLRSIQRVVDRHGGISTMYYNAERRQFHHIIQLPA